MTPIQPLALKVEGGKVSHVQMEGGDTAQHGVHAVGLDAPDGTYLRLDYVLEVVQGLSSQIGADNPAAFRALEGLADYFRQRAL